VTICDPAIIIHAPGLHERTSAEVNIEFIAAIWSAVIIHAIHHRAVFVALLSVMMRMLVQDLFAEIEDENFLIEAVRWSLFLIQIDYAILDYVVTFDTADVPSLFSS